jgi:uncharacterized cupredoxin-like copper-binding protein
LSAKRGEALVPRVHRFVIAAAVLALASYLAGCAAKQEAAGSDTLEGGVKIPTSATSTAATVDVTLSDAHGEAGAMSLTASPSVVPAGDVTFMVKNTGTIDHEAVVLKTDVAFDKLPITYGGDPPAPVKTGANKVSEDANVGETGDPNLKPGESRTFTVKNMIPGSYVIVCNLEGHYGKGMRAPLTVVAQTNIVNVTLSDSSGEAGPMTLTASPSVVPSGDVAFVVKNAGTIDHEAVVLKTDVAFDKLPITYGGDPPAPVKTGANKVSEDANVGETGDPNLKPGESRTFTVKNMAAGKYVIVCNLEGHYGKGMRAPLTVVPGPIVNVTLSDTSGEAGPMTLTASPDAVPAGDVTFVVKNTGTIEHEAVVLNTSEAFDKLPITYGGDPPAPVKTGANKVSEDANIGETGDPNLQPGDTRVFTINNMAAGGYVIVCNLAGHYGKGMRAPLIVVPKGSSIVHVTVADTSGEAGTMTLTASPDAVPAGDVTFVVKNTGTIEHEAVVLKTDVAFDKLPITYGGDPPAPVKTGGNKVSEDTNIGETGDPNLQPGDTRVFTINNMSAGNYVIVCNLAGHYGKGMRAAFMVSSL